MKVPRILHYPGSKWSMAEWIISHMPAHTTYLEPYFGSGAVLFNKPPAVLETVNDLDGSVVNLFRVIRDKPDELARAVYWTPYSRDEYLSCQTGGGFRPRKCPQISCSLLAEHQGQNGFYLGMEMSGNTG
ncbi:DNA adenine methylase [Paenibacillus borealis]|uniref:DNA adenine methylase n=1 Tax=Paenibacillus borealis TaxID=160799 RepID=UPI0026823C9F